MPSFCKKSISRSLPVLVVRCSPQNCASVLDEFRHCLVRIPGIKPITRRKMNNSSPCCEIKLDHDVPKEKLKVNANVMDFFESEVEVEYENMSSDQALERLLSDKVSRKDIPSSFETVGHIAHLNLRPVLFPFKHLIASRFSSC